MRNMSYSSAVSVDFTVSIVKNPLVEPEIVDTKDKQGEYWENTYYGWVKVLRFKLTKK